MLQASEASRLQENTFGSVSTLRDETQHQNNVTTTSGHNSSLEQAGKEQIGKHSGKKVSKKNIGGQVPSHEKGYFVA